MTLCNCRHRRRAVDSVALSPVYVVAVAVYIMADSRLAPSQWETSLQSNAVSTPTMSILGVWIECEQPNIFLYLESTIRKYGKFHNRCWGKTISWNDETSSPLIIDKTKSGQDLAVILLNWLVWHGNSRRRKPVKTKTHISTTATIKYSEKSNIILMNIILGSGLSQTCLFCDT